MRGFVVAVFAVALVLGACTASSDSPPPDDGGRLYGVALSARSGSAEDFESFFDLASDAGDVLLHNGDWGTLDAESGAFAVTMIVGEERGLIPAIGISANDFKTLIRPLDEATRADYLGRLEEFLEVYQPRYLGIGNEVNTVATENPDEYEVLVDLFADAAAIVEATSPETILYPVFQYEWLIGRRGGIFGRENRPEDEQWSLLDGYPDAEAIGITTYPGLVFSDPDEIPPDYYGAIADNTDLPIVFTEMGWQSGGGPPGYEGSDEQQARFISRFDELTVDLDVLVAIWPFIFDTQVDIVPFDSMGLRRPDGSPRPAW
ncbi:MAG: hypothetical protein ACC683_10620, partial [Acidimicrobiia bacterium]